MPQYLSAEDYADYGESLVSFSKKAALEVVAPHLQALQEDNAALRQRLAVEARHRLDQQVAAAVPNFREIDSDPRWHSWLLGIDSLSGRQRQQLLNESVASGSPHRTIAFFREFLNRAAGGAASGSHGPRAALPSGRATYTRPQVAQIYEMHRKGHWAGRDAEWEALERDIIAAGREGKIETAAYITK